MNPRTQLTRTAAELTRLATLWPTWSAIEIPDGYPTTCPGSGSAGGHTNGVSDPTFGAATSRSAVTLQQDRATAQARQLADLCAALWRTVRGDRRGTMRPHLPPVAHLEIAAEACKHSAEVWRDVPADAVVWLYDPVGEEWLTECPEDVLSAIGSHLDGLSRIMRGVAVDISAEVRGARCEDPVCDRLAVRRGLCWTHCRVPSG